MGHFFLVEIPDGSWLVIAAFLGLLPTGIDVSLQASEWGKAKKKDKAQGKDKRKQKDKNQDKKKSSNGKKERCWETSSQECSCNIFWNGYKFLGRPE